MSSLADVLNVCSVKVKWEDLEPRSYETMTAVLLSQQHPGTRRIDGAGGDGGQDLQFPGPDGLEIYELKSFTNRLNKGRRAQIKRSLLRAARQGPKRWTLIMPIDLTPGELRWFESLRPEVPFELDWRGRTWLDAQMAAHPEIPRYFVVGSADEVVQLLRELEREQAQIRSAADAVARLRVVHGRLNDIDPHYRYELTVGLEAATTHAPTAMLSVSYGDVRIDVYPRYVGADLDRPITIGLHLAFGPSDAALQTAFESMVDFGTPVSLEGPVIERVEIDAPAGIGRTFAGGALQITSPPPKTEPIRFTGEVFKGDQLLGSLPFEMRLAHGGRKGFVLTGTDASGWLDAKITIDTNTKTYKVNLGLRPAPILPTMVLPLLHWLVHARSPNSLRVNSPVLRGAAPVVLTNEPLIEEATLGVVAALSDVQRLSGLQFDLPIDLTATEAAVIVRAQRLLRGGVVRSRWSSPMTIEMTLPADSEAQLDQLRSPEGASMLIESLQEVHVREHRIPLGRVRTVIRSARLHRVLEGTSGNRSLTLELVPGADNEMVFQRVGDQAET